jgi:hypothetical protein
MNNLSIEEILFINSFFKKDKKSEEFLKDIFLTLKIPPFRVVSNSKNKSKKSLTWDSNIVENDENGKDVFSKKLENFLNNLFKKENIRNYLNENTLFISKFSIVKYIDETIENLEIIQKEFNENILPIKVQENSETKDSKFKDYFYYLYLNKENNLINNNNMIGLSEISNIDLYKEYINIIESKDKKQVYNDIIFDSKNEAENFKEIFQPLLDNGIQIILHQLYNDIIIKTSSEHSMDFYLPSLKLIIESSSYSSKNEDYYETIKLKQSLNEVSKILHETDIDFNFLLPKSKSEIPYSISKKELKEKIIKLIIDKKEELNVNQKVINNIISNYNHKINEEKIIEKFSSTKHSHLSKQNEEKIDETNDNLIKVNLGGIEINKEMVKIQQTGKLEKIKKLKFSDENDRIKFHFNFLEFNM